MEGCTVSELFLQSWWHALLQRLSAGMTDRHVGEKNEPTPMDCAQIHEQAARLLDTYGNSVLRCAYSYLHNMSDAEDVLQDALVQFLRAAPQLENAAHEKAWLLRVAVNLCKNRLKYNVRHQTDELSQELAIENREDLSFVWEAVKSLPQNYRAVIHLFYYEGYSTGQIASILQKNESTVRTDLRRGRMKLRSILKEEYDFD